MRKQLKTTRLPTRKNFGSTKYSGEKIWDPRNTNKKIFWTDEIPTRENLGPTKYPRRHDGTMALDPRDPQLHASHEIQHAPSRTNLTHVNPTKRFIPLGEWFLCKECKAYLNWYHDWLNFSRINVVKKWIESIEK